jgi:hypothetical protein
MFELLSRYSGECTGQGGIDAVCHFVYPCLPGLVFMASVSVLLAFCRPVLVYGQNMITRHAHVRSGIFTIFKTVRTRYT